MAGILPLTILLALYAVSEIISRKTHALVNTVLTISVFALLGFWTHLLPKDLFTNSGVEAFGMAIVGIMLTALGTTINLAELKRQAKVVLIAIGGALGACALIVLVASLLNRQNYGIVGAPDFCWRQRGNPGSPGRIKRSQLATLSYLRLGRPHLPKFHWHPRCQCGP